MKFQSILIRPQQEFKMQISEMALSDLLINRNEINVDSRNWPMLQKVTDDKYQLISATLVQPIKMSFSGKIDKFITDCKSVTHEAVVTALANREGLPG